MEIGSAIASNRKGIGIVIGNRNMKGVGSETERNRKERRKGKGRKTEVEGGKYKEGSEGRLGDVKMKKHERKKSLEKKK